LVLQILLGAAITALAPSSTFSKNTSITILAAANTVNADILVLMHNSGLPDRYKNDWNEFDNVEMFVKEVLESGIVRDGMGRDEVIALALRCIGMRRERWRRISRRHM
jgi:hypothetical protein